MHGGRARALAVGRPLPTVAQQAGEIWADLSIEQIFDMIVAIAKIQGDACYERYSKLVHRAIVSSPR